MSSKPEDHQIPAAGSSDHDRAQPQIASSSTVAGRVVADTRERADLTRSELSAGPVHPAQGRRHDAASSGPTTTPTAPTRATASYFSIPAGGALLSTNRGRATYNSHRTKRVNLALRVTHLGLPTPTRGVWSKIRSRAIARNTSISIHDPMIPHVIVLEPGLVIYKIYNGYWFLGTAHPRRSPPGPTRRHQKVPADWDITTPESKAAWQPRPQRTLLSVRKNVRPNARRAGFSARRRRGRIVRPPPISA